MNTKAAVSVIILILPLAGVMLSREGFLHRQAPAITETDLLKKLNIEKSDKQTIAPDFTLKDLNGRLVRLRDLRGKVVFLTFWAGWCPSCRLEMPGIEKLHGEFGTQGMVLLAINYREEPQEVLAFFNKHGLTFTTLLDPDGKIFDLYGGWSLPTTYIINKDGEIVGKAIGYRDWHSDQAKAFFRQLLQDSA